MSAGFPTATTTFSLDCATCPVGSSNAGEFYPVLTFSNGATIQFQTAVCAKCRKTLTVDDYLTAALWASIVAAETDNKTTAPRRDKTKLSFVAVTDSQADAATLATIQDDAKAAEEKIGRVAGGRFGRAGRFGL